MAKVILERTKTSLKTIRRDAVKPGQIFQLIKRDGKAGKKLYGALGNNGRLFSINLENGALASTASHNKGVAVVGKFTVNAKYNGQSETTRSHVMSGQLFRVKGGSKTYLALGRLNDGRWASVNMANPLNDDYAVTSKGSSSVTVIGTAEFHAQALA